MVSYLCYLDESGVPDIGAGTSHFVLLGLAIPLHAWRGMDAEVTRIKGSFGLAQDEIHTGWMTRRYLEQERISGFESMNWDERRLAVERERKASLLHASTTKDAKAFRELKKNYRKTTPYIHLTRDQRLDALRQLADAVRSWTECRLFGDAIDKTVFRGVPPQVPPFEEAFTSVVNRFHAFLVNYGRFQGIDLNGLLVEDNNPTVSARLTSLMREFYRRGTFWGAIHRIVEAPFFVDSSLTPFVQLADICAYATRRFLENNESDLFDRIWDRFDRVGSTVVGIRHYTAVKRCSCRICRYH